MIYDPPKGNNFGSVMQIAGTTVAGIGGVTAMTGAGLLPGVIMAGVGGVMSGIGSIVNANQEKKVKEYDQRYQSAVQGDNNLTASVNNIRQLAGIK